jgi:hypothetical protein
MRADVRTVLCASQLLFRYLSTLAEQHLETRMEAVDLADIWGV